MKKKGLLFLCVLLVMSLLPVQVFASETAQETTECMEEELTEAVTEIVLETTEESVEETICVEAVSAPIRDIVFGERHAGWSDDITYRLEINETCEVEFVININSSDNFGLYKSGSKLTPKSIHSYPQANYYTFYCTYLLGSGNYQFKIKNCAAGGYSFHVNKYAHYCSYTDGQMTVAASCTEGGYIKYYCECNDVLKVYDGTPALGHDETRTEPVAATCTAEGKTAGTKCSRCDKVIKQPEVIPMLAHTPVSAAGKEPTCTETGVTNVMKCSACGTEISSTTVPALGHSFQNRICIRCGCSDGDYLGYGNCGKNGAQVYWFLEKDGTLRITGTGDMADYADYGNNMNPWRSYDFGLIKRIVIENGVTSVGNSAFKDVGWKNGEYSPISVSIADSVTKIGYGAFSTSGVTNVPISGNVTEIGDYAFAFSNNLKEIVIPNNVLYLGESVCAYSKNLTSVKLPAGITNLQDWFSGCESLREITIPSSVTNLEGTFEFCTSLKTIYFQGSAPSFNRSTFESVYATAYYPAGNSSWTAEIKQDYGGSITWAAYDYLETTPMYRLYNPNSGEHFYTRDIAEREMLISVGWKYEGIAWNAPVNVGNPVYRLYNPNAGEHHYTTNAAERDMLVSYGWNDEGIGWRTAGNDQEPVYRVYNPNEFANNHHYTRDANERDWLVSLGWVDEGIGWYGVLK